MPLDPQWNLDIKIDTYELKSWRWDIVYFGKYKIIGNIQLQSKESKANIC